MIKIYTSNSIIKFSNKLETKTEEYRNLEDVVKGDKKSINEEEGEYEVESILDHKTNGSKLFYLVKWKGYSEDELSWIYEEDLFAEELIKQYWEKVQKSNNNNNNSSSGGDNNNISKSSRHYDDVNDIDDGDDIDYDFSSTSSTKINTRANAGTIISTKRNAAKQESRHRKFPKKPKTIKVTLDNEYEILIIDDNWENKVESIESIVRDDKTKELFVYLKWKNGKVSRHPAKEVNAKCPQKIISFYEKRLLFASSPSSSSSSSKPKN